MTEVLAALIGTIVGAFISWLANNYQNKLQTTFEMHREFDSDAMYKSRILADQLIKKNPNDTLDKIYEKYPEESLHIWQVISFYIRLWLAIKYRQVKLELVPELFGDTFVWWYVVCFEKQLTPVYRHSQARRQIVDLINWFNIHSSKSKLSEWTQHALKDYEQRVASQ
jgi:hypothetical protein